MQPPVNPEDLPDLPIYNECWVKYFHYRDTVDATKPKSFFKNEAFFKQYQSGSILKEKFEEKDSVNKLINVRKDSNSFHQPHFSGPK
jgi:hypothetical protein